MSAFLGPIHFWLYNKIQIQQGILEEILNSCEDDIPKLRDELDREYGISETRPLEEVIDEGNIHGWLQESVSQVEYKLAYCITALLEKNPDIVKKIEAVFDKKGKEIAASISLENASDAYKTISDSLLDGMPCDHANTVLEETDKKVVWKRNTCVHHSYWEEIGGDINIYYHLRDVFIRGILKNTSLVYEKMDDVTCSIMRRTENE